MEQLPLDQPTLKALAGETRVKILKLLDRKPQTQSDISLALKMSLPTVAEHLNSLLHAELIEREETTRKWKYYSLTQKARMLLHPHTGTIWFVLGLFLLSAAATVFSAINYFTQSFVETTVIKPEAFAAHEYALVAPTYADNAINTAPSPVFLIAFGIATTVLLAVLISLLLRHGWLGKSLTNKKNI